MRRTPVFTCGVLDERVGAQLHFKCENLQKTGAFKFRGACNALLQLSPGERAGGVATHSSGNHGAALSLAARRLGTRATVVMPENSNRAKVAAVRRYGGEVIPCAAGDEARQAALERVCRARGAVFVHPFDSPAVIAGQGTAGLELLHQVPGLDAVIVPVGGGGLLSGVALAATGQPGLTVLAAEPAGADDAYRSLAAGRLLPNGPVHTIADGLRTGLSDLTYTIIKRHVSAILTVTEAGIRQAMGLLWSCMKLVVEPSSAVPLAALLQCPGQVAGQRVGVVLTGGNVDVSALAVA